MSVILVLFVYNMSSFVPVPGASGGVEYGFISVPKDWVKFIDVDGNSTIQYSYGITWISTIFSLDVNITDAQNYATVVYSKLSDDGVSDLKAETEKVNGYKAYKVYGYYTDEGKWLVCWFIDGKNDKTYYIAVEGPDLDNDYFKNIIQTFDENEQKEDNKKVVQRINYITFSYI